VTTFDPKRLENIVLSAGTHAPNVDGNACLLEAVASVAGELWSDAPQCVSPAIAAYGRGWNDALANYGLNDKLQALKTFIPRMIGTRTTPEAEIRRAWLCCNFAVHIAVPWWLVRADLSDEAALLAQWPEVTPTNWREAREACLTAGSAADSAADSAGGAVGEAVGTARAIGRAIEEAVRAEGAYGLADSAARAIEEAAYAAPDAVYAPTYAAYAAPDAVYAPTYAAYAARAAAYAADAADALRELYPQMRALLEAMITA
jgi:hypothetical protein